MMYVSFYEFIFSAEEITISYLGEELLLPTLQRQWLLWRSKCHWADSPTDVAGKPKSAAL